jgi:hypothetical protein
MPVEDATAYEVWYGTLNNSASAAQFGGDIAVLGTAITGLAAETTYYVWIKAKNTAGTSGFSPAATGMSLSPPPPAPNAPTLTPGSTQLTVTWTAVNGATAYEVWRGTSNNSANAAKFGADITGGTTSVVITGLTNETTYYVWIKAKNSMGTSDFSPAASGIPMPLPPAAPAAPALYQADSQLAASWTAVSGATAYEVWYGDSNNSASAARFGSDITGTSAIITGLTNGTACYVWIKAKNSVGVSGFSPAASGTPAAATGVPAAPAAPMVTRGDGTLIVTWIPVEGATEYEVRYGTGAATILFGSFTGTSAVITGLVNTTLYRVRLRAQNSAGYSGYSGNTIAVIAPAAPNITAGDTQLVVSWTTVTGATAYEVWFNEENNAATARQSGGDIFSPQTTATITGLTNGTVYYVWVKAKTAASWSGFSPGASGTPQSHQVTVGYAGGNITITDSAGTAVSGITLSKTGSQTITLNADGAFTGVVWYIDGSNGIVTTKLTLSAAGYAVSKHFVTFTGWWNGAYVSSAPIPFTVTN